MADTFRLIPRSSSGTLTLLLCLTVMMMKIPSSRGSLDLWNWRDTSSSESQKVTPDSDESDQINVVSGQNWNILNLDLWNVRQSRLPTGDGIDQEKDPKSSDFGGSNMQAGDVDDEKSVFQGSNLRSVPQSDFREIDLKTPNPDASDQAEAVSEKWSILNLVWPDTKATADNGKQKEHTKLELDEDLQTKSVSLKWSFLAFDLWNWRDTQTPTTEDEADERKTSEVDKLVVHKKIDVSKEWSFLGRDITKDSNVKLDARKIKKTALLPIKMLLSGVMAVAFVQLFVWFIGFGKHGIRKRTMAAALIKYRNGFVPANSWLSTLQSVGAGGLGRKRMIHVCLCGAVTYLTWDCIRFLQIQH